MVGEREFRGGQGQRGMVGRVSVGMASDGGEGRLVLCVTTGIGGVCSAAWWWAILARKARLRLWAAAAVGVMRGVWMVIVNLR